MESYIFGQLISGINFNETPLCNEYEQCIFKNCIFHNCDLSHKIFRECKFESCDLSLSKMNNTTLSEIDFLGCKILGVQFNYGFRFTNAGVVYPIINGAVSKSYIATDVDGTDISIRKEGKNIYLRVDGTGSAARTISLSDATDTDTNVGIIRKGYGSCRTSCSVNTQIDVFAFLADRDVRSVNIRGDV